MLNISLRPEYVLSVFGFLITNTFLTSVLVTAVLGALAIVFYVKKDGQKNAIRDVMKIIVYELLKFVDTVTENRKLSEKILPLIASFFIFIVTANIFGLIPGFLGSFFVSTASGNVPLLRSPNSDLTTTLALAVFSVLAIQFFSIGSLGIKNYIGRFLNFASPVKFVLGFFEIISEATKLISFSFRLFGNIFAGEVLMLVIAFLMPYVIPLPFMVLEIFVGVIQAFIFSALTLTFIKNGTIRHIGSSA